MFDSILSQEAAFSPGLGLHAAMTLAEPILRNAGFEVAAYDFSPVPISHEGAFLLPTVLTLHGAPDDMERLWVEDGYYTRDPVMEASLAVTRPFHWSHTGPQSEIMRRTLSEHHSPVVSYLHDTHMTSGITVPLRTASGALATFTAIRLDPDPHGEAAAHVSAVGYLGRLFHDAVMPGFGPKQLRTPHVSLSPRERQCLKMCAAGLTTKQIAHELSRSEPTVTLHLGSAARKLGARNRVHAIALAAHYRLLADDA
ncbi:Transcriptional activator protein TraR [Marinibacterium anthonyi]|nr:Transcriptional activator protein TraR [Marinibacterium anthonyi]